jgi:diguanylate cyclase
VAWVVGYLAIGVAALRGSRVPEDDDEAVDDRPSMRRLALPYLAIVAAGVARLVLAVLGRPVDGVLTGTAVALIVLVLLRQLLTLRENVELSQHLSGRLDDLKAREDELRFQAFHDPLTGLANRQLFRDRVQHALDRRRRTLQPGAVLFLDLDDFKTVNDRLGHAAGDELLGDVARRLEACVRAGDTVARLGGDEFGVLLEELADVEDATAVADRMTDALTTPFTVAGRELTVRASVGIAYTAMLDETAEQLLGNADVALYAAKAAGKGGIRVFEHSMRSAVVERLELVADLQSAFERGELVVYYQPVVRLDDGCTTAVEALVRWRHPTRGLLSPGSFVALAEETGLIAPLGRTVLDQACRQVAEWQQSLGLPSLAVHVNLSARQLQRSEVVEEVHAALESSGLLPEHLVLEVTESILVRHGETGLDRLHTLKGLGVQLGIDDFGTGYSSLNYLRLLPVDVIKIDKAFAAPLGRRQEDMLLLQAIVDLGRSLGVAMIAEGIERADQAEALREIGCELAQGYWFAVPAEPREIEARLAIHHPAELTGSP